MTNGVRKLAQETGLSTATVSRALNDSKGVTPATRQVVLDAAERMGYRPNAAARALTTKRSRTVGAIIPTLENSIFALFINSLEDTLAARGYSLVIATTHNDPELESKRAKDLLHMGTEGLIVSGQEHSREFLTLIQSRGIPTIATSIYSETSPIPCIGYDNEYLGKMAAEHLKSLGHVNPAILHGPLMTNDRTQLRLKGVRNIFPECKTYETSLSVKGGVMGCRHFIKQDNPIDALLCLSDILALGAIFEASNLGVSIPDQLSVMGFDNLEWADSITPSLTTINLPVTSMGQRAATSLMDHLEDNRPILNQRLDSQLLVRHSVKNRRA